MSRYMTEVAIRDQRALALFSAEHLSMAQIGERFGERVSVIARRIKRARARLEPPSASVARELIDRGRS